jgi:redox-sensitive bicupin YhaK (pirin superfamily)
MDAPITVSRRPAFVQDVIVSGPTAQTDHNMQVLPPDNVRWDPFILLMDDRFSTVGFPWHPHRGFQTLTFVLDGLLEHKDNGGGHGILGPGDAQYMAAGRFALHSEMAHELRPVRTLQLWLNLPPHKKHVDTSYRDLRAADAALIEEPGVRARLYAGRHRDVAGAPPETFHVPLTLVDVHLDAGARFVHELPGQDVAALYVLEGDVTLSGDHVPADAEQVAWFAAGEPGASELVIEAKTDARVLVYSAAPIGAPVVAYGPFVMTTQEEIAEAFADYRAGRFGPIPAD